MSSSPAERLSEYVRLPTVAGRIDEPEIREALDRALEYLQITYPEVMSAGEVTADGPWRMVVEIPGIDKSLDPMLLIAHYDVVDAEPGTLGEWSHEPFSGDIADGFIWGRGTLDDKSLLLAMLEATARVLAEGRPLRRGVVLAFGGDEEIAGRKGAGVIAQRFADEGRRFHCVFDEGSIISRGLLKDPPNPIALIGVAEKGHMNIRISAEVEGGHAAMPPSRTALGLIGHAIARVESGSFRPRLLPTIRDFFQSIGGRAKFPIGFVYRNLRILWPLVRGILLARRETAALVRSTHAVTMASGSRAPNVLPSTAEAIVNVRILPGETTADVERHFRRALKGIPVEVSVLGPEDAHDPVPPSRTDHSSYEAAAEAARRLEPECIVAPFLVIGSTDSRWYAPLADAVIRLAPMVLDNEDLRRIHGVNERIGIQAYEKMIDFYHYVIEKECVND